MFNIKKIVFILTLCVFFVETSWASFSLSYEKFYRVNTPDDITRSEDWFGINYEDSYSSKDKSIGGFSDIDFLYFPQGVSSLNYSISSLYIHFQSTNKNSFWGRKIVPWNPYEKYWSLGQLNGNQAFKLLSHKQEGLIGYHLEVNFLEHLIGSFFISYLHIPALNPQVKIENGKAIGNSEWMRKPPAQTIVNEGGSAKSIYYKINDPELRNIVINKSLGFNLHFFYEGFSANMYSIYKPEPVLRVNAEAVFDLLGDRVIVTANPIVNHHTVAGFNISYDYEEFHFGISFQGSDPNAKLGKDFEVLDPVKLQKDHRTFDSEFLKIEPNYEKETYFMSRIRFKDLNLLMELNYITLLSSNERASDDFFSETVKWKNAIGAIMQYQVTDEVLFGIDYRFDVERLDQILNLTSSFKIMKGLDIMIGGELIKAPKEVSYWSIYRANDSFYSTIRYHF